MVAAAERLLERHGPSALTVRRMAAEAGVAPMGVYNHFGGKDGVIERLFVRGFDKLREAFADIPTGDPVEDLVEAGRRYRSNALAHPGTYSIMFDRAVPGFEPSRTAKAHALASFDGLVGLVRRAMDLQALLPGDPVGVAQQLWSLCHGHVSLELRGIGFVRDVEALQEAAQRAHLRGLAPG